MRFVFKIVHKCNRCKKEHKLGDFRSGSKIFNSCIRCRDRCKKSQEKNKCEHHNRRKYQCKDCGGVSICEHNKRKSTCKECGDPIDITIKHMIRGSKKYDKKKKKYDETHFIDYPFIQNLISESNGCFYCHCDLQYTYYTNNLATIERINNELGHIKSNCVIACRTCNLSRVGDNSTI